MMSDIYSDPGMAATMSQGISVTVHLAPPAQQEWDAMLAWISPRLRTFDRFLVFSMGGAPNARQRAQLKAEADKLKLSYPWGAVISDSAIVRGAATALSWIAPSNVRVYAPKGVDEAYRFLGLDELQAARMDGVRDRLIVTCQARRQRKNSTG